MFEPGSVVADKYRVGQLLGRGGMGLVVAAEHVELRTQVALKFLADRYARQPRIVERFLREARACARLESEHVCRVFDVARTSSGVPFIVMELLDGGDLKRVLRSEGPLSEALVADYLWQACDAITEAHEANIIHRDLKPANLFLARRKDGRSIIKVLDFGVAKVHDEHEMLVTATGKVVGTPSYMAPEQLRSARAADVRSDIWSLGVILHELATGIQPFGGDESIELAMRIAHQPIELSPALAPSLAAVVARCLQRDPNDRFQTVRELASALAPIAGRDLRAATTQPSAVDHPAPVVNTLMMAPVSRSEPPLMKRGIAIAAIAGAIAIGIGAAHLVSERQRADDAQTTFVMPTLPVVKPPPPPPVPEAKPAEAVPEVDLSEPEPTKAVEPRRKTKRPKTKEQVGASRI